MTQKKSNSSIVTRFPTSKVELFPIYMDVIKPKIDLSRAIRNALKKNNFNLKNGDIIAIASKIISTAEGRICNIKKIIPSRRAEKIAKKYKMDSKLVEIILRETDRILGGIPQVLLTLKDGILTANAGIDISNVPPGHISLWPSNPQKSADNLRKKITDQVKFGVVIVDSRVTPLRLGTVGQALAVSGFSPTVDLRGLPDIYGKPLSFTWHSIADDLASAAHYLMGETNRKIPIVVIRGANVPLENEETSLKITCNQCLYMSYIQSQIDRN